MNLEFESLITLDDGYELDGVFVDKGDPMYGQIVAYIKSNDTPDNSQRDARKQLDDTDWYIIRQVETGEPIPDDIKTKRAAARAALGGNRG